MRALLSLTMLLAGLLLLVGSAAGQDAGFVAVGEIKGVINPVTASYVERAIGQAEAEGARALVFKLDTPGGLDSSMRQINQRILASRVPIIVYVAPPGARAGSAGVYIAYAAHLAAMAPNTNIGSAHPVAIGQDGGERQMSEDMRRKVENDAVAYIESLARQRGRNVEWAIKAVRESDNITEQRARELGVINFIAPTLDSLLEQADGARVETPAGPVTLRVKDLPTRSLDMTPIEQFLHAISDPTIAFLLLSLGTMGLYFELANPGTVLPGVIGGIFLLLGFFALGALPVNLAGLLLILFALLLFIADIFSPTSGVLSGGGLIAFVLGAMILINVPDNAPYLEISRAAIVAVAVFMGGFFLLVARAVARSRRRRAVTGQEALIGLRGRARTALNPEGLVFVDGELWSARSDDGEIKPGDPVEVVAVHGLRLTVRSLAPGPWPNGSRAASAPAAEPSPPASEPAAEPPAVEAGR